MKYLITPPTTDRLKSPNQEKLKSGELLGATTPAVGLRFTPKFGTRGRNTSTIYPYNLPIPNGRNRQILDAIVTIFGTSMDSTAKIK